MKNLFSRSAMAVSVFISVLSVAACVEDVNGFFLEDKDVLVVDCVLEPGKTQECRLSFMKGSSDSIFSKASVTLTDLDEDNSFDFVYQSEGTFVMDYNVSYEHRYRLDVDVPGYEPASAETTIPKQITGYVKRLSSGIVRVAPYKDSGPLRLWVYAIRWTNFINGEWELVPYIASSCLAEDSFNLTDVKITDLMGANAALVDSLISERYYEPDHYWDSHVWEENKVYADKSVAMTIADRVSSSFFHDRYIRIPYPEDYDNGLGGHLSRGFSVFVPKQNGGRFGLCVDSVSEEYDLYLKDALKRTVSGRMDLTNIYDRSNAYTNFDTCVGIFGALTRSVTSIN